MACENPYLQIDRLMVGDIYTAREVMDNLIVLCDELGSRFAGTPEERKAAEFIAETFKRYGLNDVRLEPYTYAGWSRGAATLEVVEPMPKSLPCISLPYCPAAEVTAELVSVGYGSPAEFEKLGDQMHGRVVMANSASPHHLGRWVHRKEKFERAVLGGASAFIFVSESPGVGPETGSLQNDKPAPIPGISVCYEDGLFLKRLIERNGRVVLRLRTTDVNEPRTSWNVVADLPGSEHPEQMVILGCHYDGHDISQGAVDPASGMVVVMEAARVLAAHARDALKRTVRFIGFGTEEIGLIGSYRYVDAHEDELDNVRFVLNLDAAGGGSRKGLMLHHCSEVEEFFKQAAKEMAAEMPLGHKMHPYSDHYPFFVKGVPCASMGDPDSPPKGRGFGHTAYDTLDKVELAKLREASAVAARVALRVANADDFPARRRQAEEVEQIIATDPDLEGVRVARELAQRRGV
ncbi:MAG: M28 family peptidase [Abditibacteriales bacterium]|nr:M28 family peptidase [Abditibacteriales bacterium]MDW8365127.1 M28 family peptidase [Abditibacteriales bacterium]